MRPRDQFTRVNFSVLMAHASELLIKIGVAVVVVVVWTRGWSKRVAFFLNALILFWLVLLMVKMHTNNLNYRAGAWLGRPHAENLLGTTFTRRSPSPSP